MLGHLPSALEGLRIAHLTDLHITRDRGRHRWIAQDLRALSLDLVLFTGDYMSDPGDEATASRVMERVCGDLRPRLGMFGVFGNHDTPLMRRLLKDLPITWIHNGVETLSAAGIQVLGFDQDCDREADPVLTAWALGKRPQATGSRPLRLLLCHRPIYLSVASDMGVDLMFSGHTHGGQCRLPTGHALCNSSKLPLRLTSGILRHRDTLCAVSRGLGEVTLPLRLFCPPHLPVYTLRPGPLEGQRTEAMENVRKW